MADACFGNLLRRRRNAERVWNTMRSLNLQSVEIVLSVGVAFSHLSINVGSVGRPAEGSVLLHSDRLLIAENDGKQSNKLIKIKPTFIAAARRV